MQEILTREFDSFIFQKTLTGLIKPAFFMSNYDLFYSILWHFFRKCDIL